MLPVVILYFLLFFFLLLQCHCSTYFYQNWKNLPYCTTKEQIPKTAIQPLTSNQLLHEPELIQVHVLARHGARAPYTTKMSCWEATPNPIEVEWNCSYVSVNSYDVNATTNEYGRLYRHIFDSGNNQLNGTCKLGSLLPMGIYQHHENGKLLQHAYIGEGKLKLFRTNDLAKIRPSDLYLRSDDLERTIASGHALMNGMFPPEKQNTDNKTKTPMLSWHLQDFATDILYPNPRLCPILTELSDAAISSSEFYKFSMDSLELQIQLNSILGDFKWDEMYECAALARCNNIPLPNGITEDLFDSILNNTQHRAYIQLTFDDAFYSKLSMTPLLNFIFDEGIEKMIKDSSNESKLKIIMVHDSTHMALLAALLGKKWDGIWSTYASLFNIELYKINQPVLQNETASTRRFSANETHAIRFLYKGVPIRLPICFDELCGLKQIQEYISFRVPFARCDDVTANIKKEKAIINLKSLSDRKLTLGKFIFYFTIFGSLVAVIIILLHANYQRHRTHQRENETTRLLY